MYFETIKSQDEYDDGESNYIAEEEKQRGCRFKDEVSIREIDFDQDGALTEYDLSESLSRVARRILSL